jgi:hypothetical protein
MLYLKATLHDGTVVVSEFSRLRNVQRYATQVFAGIKPFNVWTVVSTTHPASGEPVLFRTQELVNGRDIERIERVKPITTDSTAVSLDPSNFVACPVMQRGERGVYMLPADQAEHDGIVAGVEYPVHRDPSTMADYIITGMLSGEPVRYNLNSMTPQAVEQSYHEDEDEDEVAPDWGDDDGL